MNKKVEVQERATMEVVFAFKCRRCGGKVHGAHASKPTADICLMALILGDNGRTLTAILKVGRGMAPTMHATHRCKDGGSGIADLQGYEPWATTTTLREGEIREPES